MKKISILFLFSMFSLVQAEHQSVSFVEAFKLKMFNYYRLFILNKRKKEIDSGIDNFIHYVNSLTNNVISDRDFKTCEEIPVISDDTSIHRNDRIFKLRCDLSLNKTPVTVLSEEAAEQVRIDMRKINADFFKEMITCLPEEKLSKCLEKDNFKICLTKNI